MVNHVTQPINWGDLLRDTMHLNTTAFGAYVRLIGHYWSHEGLPTDDKSLWHITKLEDIRQWRRYRPILQEFFHDGWKHKRIDRDLAKRKKFHAEQKQKAERRWAVDNSMDGAVSGYSPSGSKGPDGEATNSLKSNGAGDAAAMPTFPLEERKNLSSSSSLHSVPREAEKNLKNNSNGSESPAAPSEFQSNVKAKRKARQAWEAALAKELDPELYAKAIDVLANDENLCERATKAERRNPNPNALGAAGAAVAMIGVKRHLLRRGAA